MACKQRVHKFPFIVCQLLILYFLLDKIIKKRLLFPFHSIYVLWPQQSAQTTTGKLQQQLKRNFSMLQSTFNIINRFCGISTDFPSNLLHFFVYFFHWTCKDKKFIDVDSVRWIVEQKIFSRFFFSSFAHWEVESWRYKVRYLRQQQTLPGASRGGLLLIDLPMCTNEN